jgi:CheY-like chemotaxis protein
MEEDLYRTGKLESVGLLAGGIAHDFNNILSGILGNAELAKITGSRGEDAGPFLERILKATRRATALTNQLLTFAKGGEPIIKSINLPDLIRENVEFALSGSPIKGGIDLSDNLWSVYADPGQIGQVISNLLINAAQASSEGDNVRVTAANIVADNEEIAGLAPGRYVVITIQDHGVGIAPENMAKIFDPYFTTKDYGTGLGLTISYSIIRKHNGHIMLNSRLGEGTTFNIYLPASFEEVKADNQPAMTVISSHKGKILIVDDEEDLRIILVNLLERYGYGVLSVTDGAEALSAYKEAMAMSEPFDLVITDLTIPGGMGGKELVERLLETDAKAKVIVASGYSHDPIMAQFQRYGFKGVIEKPFEFSTITDTVARVISGD